MPGGSYIYMHSSTQPPLCASMIKGTSKFGKIKQEVLVPAIDPLKAVSSNCSTIYDETKPKDRQVCSYMIPRGGWGGRGVGA
jgi:hypothetical protein